MGRTRAEEFPRRRRGKPPPRRRKSGFLARALAGALLLSLGLGAGALAALMLDPGGAASPPGQARKDAEPAALFQTSQIPSARAGFASPPVSPEALWIRNAAPFGPDPRPRLAVILLDQGRDPALSAAALRAPGPLNLALAAHLENLKDRIAGVRSGGHEALVALPFDKEPPGILAGGALMSNLPVEENLRRLRWRLGQAPQAVGVLGAGGESVTRDLKLMEAVMAELRNAGALFVDSRAHPESLAGAAARRMGTPAGDVSLRFDETPDLEVMLSRLAEAEGRAMVWGTAIAMAELTPQTLEALRRWSGSRGPEAEASVALAPVSAVVKRLRSAAPEAAAEISPSAAASRP